MILSVVNRRSCMKKLLIGLLCLVVIIGISTSCTLTPIEDVPSDDETTFKNEYESLNGERLDVSIPEKNKMKYATAEEVLALLEDGTGVIYFGFPECPWCRNMVSVLIESALDTELENILYFNALSIRDTKHLDENGTIVTDHEGSSEYYELLEKLSSVLGPYEGLNDDTIKRLYFPTVVFVKEGTIVGSHIGTLDSQSDPSIVLDTDQKEELYQIYINGIQQVLGMSCESGKTC